ncbi:ABC-2 type transporter family protein [Striga asiatica]|uniref:ABC-2 type transporter family protein n=1 Tax=Striga asiatica TaxID=4170 RepID=A0A5A7R985_STRAF|nr:ABC-2 type transporter family protein [Striga asiatica]
MLMIKIGFCFVVESGGSRDSSGDTVLAGLRFLSRLGGARRRKVKVKVMEWWRKMAFPVKKAWLVVSARKKGAGLLKLHDDIQTCGYEDVQIMWEMLRRSESQVISHHKKRKQRWFMKNLAWFNHGQSGPSLSTHQSQ